MLSSRAPGPTVGLVLCVLDLCLLYFKPKQPTLPPLLDTPSHEVLGPPVIVDAMHVPRCWHLQAIAEGGLLLRARPAVLRGAGGALVLVIYDEFKKLIDANIA